jgi:hypothetical protein
MNGFDVSKFNLFELFDLYGQLGRPSCLAVEVRGEKVVIGVD